LCKTRLALNWSYTEDKYKVLGGIMNNAHTGAIKDSQIGNGNHLVYRRSWAYYSHSLFLVGILGISAVVLLWMSSNPQFTNLFIPSIASLIGCIVVFLIVWMARKSMSLTLSREHLLLRQGVFSRKEQMILIHQVAGINVAQTLFQRVCKMGDITIESTGMDAVNCYGLQDPHGISSLVRSYQMHEFNSTSRREVDDEEQTTSDPHVSRTDIHK
jgi:uncharacterized membrane protein YdbT with pleckstrin-like domain